MPKLHKPLHEIKLDDDECGRWSIYLLKQDGTLWTIRMTGDKPGYEAYKQVRTAKAPVAEDALICVKCKRQWTTMPLRHGEAEV